MNSVQRWQFWIDVGGTFTDCIGRAPDGTLHTCKTLSTGVTKGVVHEISDADAFRDPARAGDPVSFWSDYELRLLDHAGAVMQTTGVAGFDSGRFRTVDPLPSSLTPGTPYELLSREGAPLLCIRQVLGLTLDGPVPRVDVRLGTTRGTNALLERKGAATALVTTRGFGDVLLIANQDRPRLFDLAIRQPEPLFKHVVEIDERLTAEGKVLREPDANEVRTRLAALKETGVESLAICLLHAFANPTHEELVERIARELGFEEISTSSRLSPLIKIVSRGDTTTMDAYLNPILRRYVASLRDGLASPDASPVVGGSPDPPTRPTEGLLSAAPPHAGGRPPVEECGTVGRPATTSSLKLMTSSGGLVDADRFVGKDSILSGPAGGVIGYSRVAEQAGFHKSIGFDMGGTSTDVSRYDGSYELEYETKKGGVRVVAPMLAIETVAAGGGSICGFDGVKLVVGPESAGADPGPACYGRGGPLSVTDVNFALGRILPSRFPFPLDRSAVERRLEELCEQIAASPLGQRYTPVELAQGFVDIANANMVRAIRRISVARGYDPAEYALVTFGGAGAQHACAMARELGIRQILVHPWAGILSAYGMGLADVRRHAERAVLQPYSAETLDEIEPLFVEMERQLHEEVLAEGVPADRIAPPVRSLDMRYRGVESTITVSRPDSGDYAAEYEQLHEQLFGYRHVGRPIEITAARVEVVGTMAASVAAAGDVVPRTPQPAETAPVWFAGVEHDSGVFDRAEIRPGDRIEGPAVICEPTSTIIIEPGFTAEVLSRGEVLITDVQSEMGISSRGPSATETADPVQLEIFNNLFASIAEQMGVTLQKTSVSTNVKERLDFSCALFDPQGNLVVNAPHIPVHLGAMSETVKAILADNPDLGAGDVFVTNDPFRGGSHLPDVTVITPVFDAAGGELIFLTASRAHHAEIGGTVPGSLTAFSTNLGEEGVLIRNFKLVDGGRSREEEFKQLLLTAPFPTRNVSDNLADVSAQVAANNTGVRLLRELVARYSLPVVQAYMGHIQQAASAKMRMALADLPDGRYEMTDHLDEGAPISAAITIAGDRATVDFTGTGDVLHSNLNANRAIVSAAVLYVFRCLINEDIPLNSGVLEPVDIILPECLLNPPPHEDPAQCAAVVGGNVETSQRVVDVLLGALRVAAASQGTMNNLTFGNETFGYYETICGGSGATPDADGADAVHTHMTNTRLTDVEVIERRYPVRIQEFSIRRGSGGDGKHRGGDGIVRRIEFLAPLKVSILAQRRGPYPPFGLDGGQPGALGRNTLRRHGADEDVDVGGRAQLEMQPGDVLTIETPGGGGYGADLFPEQGQWKESDYLLVDTDCMLEFDHGYVELLPMPTIAHQLIVGCLMEHFETFIRPKAEGEVIHAPVPVRLWKGKYRQPDIFYLKPARVVPDFPDGADLVVEVVSEGPEDRVRDYETKRAEYARAGIPEYWIVDPQEQLVTVLTLAGDSYQSHGEFRPGEQATSVLLDGLQVDVAEMFRAAEGPPASDA